MILIKFLKLLRMSMRKHSKKASSSQLPYIASKSVTISLLCMTGCF